MGKSLVALVVTVFTTVDVFGQALPIDAARDRALVTPVRAFLNDTITVDQLERELREPDNVCASAPRPASLEPARANIELQVGQPFAITPENHLHPIRAGTFHLRVRTICSDRFISVSIPATIH